MRQLLILSIFIFISFAAWAGKKGSDRCEWVELQNKDCHLKVKGHHLHLWGERIFINDKIHRKLYNMPYAGDDVEWVRAKMSKVNGRNILQVLIWAPAEGEGQVQKLMWHVYEVDKVMVKELIGKNVQRRMPNKSKERMPSSEGEKQKKSFALEKQAKFGLIPRKNKRIHWFVNNRKGSF